MTNKQHDAQQPPQDEVREARHPSPRELQESLQAVDDARHVVGAIIRLTHAKRITAELRRLQAAAAAFSADAHWAHGEIDRLQALQQPAWRPPLALSLIEQAARLLREPESYVSVSFLQRKLKLGYQDCVRIMEALEADGNKPPRSPCCTGRRYLHDQGLSRCRPCRGGGTPAKAPRRRSSGIPVVR